MPGAAALLAGALVCSGASATAAWHAEGPPAGHTGGFGEPTCQACHAEYALNPAGATLALEGWPERYEAGRDYVLTVALHSRDMERAGFQLAIRDEEGRQAGRLAGVDARVAVTDSAGIAYAQHTAAGSSVEGGQTQYWTLSWTAPLHGRPLMAHVAANSANGDDSPFGDLIYAGVWQASPAAASQPAEPQR